MKGEVSIEHKASVLKRLGGCPAYLYAIRGPGLYKFGISQNPYTRLRGMQTDNPYKLELLGFVFATSQVEQQLHCYLSADNHSGEWFRPEPRPIACAYLIASKDLDGLLELIEYKPIENIMGVDTYENRSKMKPSQRSERRIKHLTKSSKTFEQLWG